MPEGTAAIGLPDTLLPDRACGSCNVCCVALTINDPQLQKPQGYRCRNAVRDGSCAIYESRPQTCREFYCGWRRLKWIRQTLRPDLSGVLIRLHGEILADGSQNLGIAVTLLSNSALKAEGLAETVAAAVTAGVPVWIHVPGPPGYTSSQAKLNDALAAPVACKDKAAVLGVIRVAHRRGSSGPRKPIVLGPPGADASVAGA